jgi:hypothetical protein
LIGCGVVQLPSSFFVMPELDELIAGECTMLLPKPDDFESQASSMVLNLGLSGCHYQTISFELASLCFLM